MPQSVAVAVKNKFSTSPIKRKYKVLIDWLKATDTPGTITVSEWDGTNFPKAHTKNDLTECTYSPYFIVSDYQEVGEGIYLIDAPGEKGCLANVRSDINGDFVGVQEFKQDYNEAHEVENIVVFFSNFSTAEDFVIKYKDTDNVWQTLDTVIGNTETYYTKYFDAITNIKGVSIEISKIIQGDMLAHVIELGTLLQENISDEIIDFNIDKNLEYKGGTLDIGNISANKLTLMLKNTDRKYNEKNLDSPVYRYLKANKKIKPYIGVDMGDGSIEYIAQGIFYTKNITPKPNMVAEIKAVDGMGLMNEKDFIVSELYENKKISEMITTLVTNYGLSSDEYSIQTTTYQIPYVFFRPASYASLIKKLVIAEGGYAYFDELGIFQFKNRDWVNTEIAKHYTDSLILKNTASQPYVASKMKNRIKIKSRPLYLSEQKNIYTLNDTITVEKNSSKTIPCYFLNSPCKDVQNAVITKDAAISVVENKYNYAIFLTFTNATGGDLTVTAIIIEGKPLVEEGITIADVSDSDLIFTYGEKLYTIDNPYIQNDDESQELASSLLASKKDPSPDITFEALSMPWIQLGDRIAVKLTKLNLGGELF